MRILFLTQVLPYPLDAGPKARAYYVLRALSEQHEVTLLSFVRATDSPAAIAHLEKFCTRVVTVPITRSRTRDLWFLATSLVTGTPFVIARDRSPAMERAIRLLLAGAGPFDAIHADQLWMAPYALLAAGAHVQTARPHLVLDEHNATWRIFERLSRSEGGALRRLVLRLESRKLARFEAAICRRFDAVVWVTEEDVQTMAEVAGGRDAVPVADVIPICIDAEAEPVAQRSQHPRRITFLGGLHYPPNAQGVLWFAEKVFPSVLAREPDAILTVIGRDPPAALEALGLPARSLEATGYVPDPMPYLQETAVFIVPLLAGGGMRVKIVDGWRWALPIVSTTVGAEGIRYDAGTHLLVADEPEQFADAVVDLLRDPFRQQRLGLAGRAWVTSEYHWRTVYRRWLKIYDGFRTSRPAGQVHS